MPGYTGNDFKKKHDLQKTRQGEKRERKGGKMLKQNREQNGEDGEGGFDTTNILMSFTFLCFLSI
jgi:hypothetical protein